jgi:hypothetical protein
VDRARVASPWVHRGPHRGRWLELTGARPSGRSGAQRFAAEALEARGRLGDPSSGLTMAGEAARWASDGGEQSSVAALGVRGAQGERVGGRGVERWKWGLPYIGLGGGRGTADEAGNGRRRCGLKAVSYEAGYRGGEEEVAPIEGGQRRRRLSGVWPRAEDVDGGARVAWWRRPKEAVVRRPEEGETPGGPSWAGVGCEQGRLREIPKKIKTGCQGHQAELKK